MSVVFFFQAEDGIRDGHVTGVQTCALPISQRPRHRVLADRSANPMARTLCPQLDPEEAVARWRELRAERARPEPQELDQAASRGGPGTSHGRRRWWRFGRRSQGPFRPLSGPPAE